VPTDIQGAPSYDVANAVAKSVASSSLVKTAMYGEGKLILSVYILEADSQMRTGVESYAQCKLHWFIRGKSTNTDSGYTSLPASTISPTSVSVSFIPPSTAGDTTPLKLLTNGEPEENIDEDRAAVILKEEDLEVEIDLGNGQEEARVWTCDFSHVSLSLLQ
jgi:glutamate N-acetyltransferase/amino-acid N-acetyltransferase